MKKPLYALFITAILGVLITGYLTYVHYSGAEVACPIGGTGSCEAVLTSHYSVFGGLPVAIWGMLTWLTILYFTYHLYKKHTAAPDARHPGVTWTIFILASLGVMAAGYFNGTMLFKLKQFCMWCEASHALMLAAFFVAGYLAIKPKHDEWLPPVFITAIVLLSLPLGVGAFTGVDPAVYDTAACLTEKGTVMYGAYWCPHCSEQKALFGDAFKDIVYIECADPVNPRSQTQACIDANIESYPTWIRTDGERQTGVRPVEYLASWSGCQVAY